jgi:hypothetical protein
LSTKKLPSQASYEELLAALESDDIEVEDNLTATEDDLSKLTDDTVIIFLSHFNITTGTNAVSARLLYDLYKKHTLDPLDRHRFAIAIGKYIRYYTNRKGTFYQINMDAFKVTEEILKLKVKSRKNRDKSPGYRKSFEKFLKECEITTGQYWLQGFIIYEIYLDYCKSKGLSRPAYAFKPFIQMLKVYFTGTRRTSNRSLWFNVNEKTHQRYSPEQKKEIEAGRSQKKRKYKRKVVE